MSQMVSALRKPFKKLPIETLRGRAQAWLNNGSAPLLALQQRSSLCKGRARCAAARLSQPARVRPRPADVEKAMRREQQRVLSCVWSLCVCVLCFLSAMSTLLLLRAHSATAARARARKVAKWNSGVGVLQLQLLVSGRRGSGFEVSGLRTGLIHARAVTYP